MSDNDQRQHPRYEGDDFVAILHVEAKQYQGLIDNISISGVFLQTEICLGKEYVGNVAKLVVDVDIVIQLVITCQIVHCGDLGVGLRFKPLSSLEQDIIELLIEQYVKNLESFE